MRVPSATPISPSKWLRDLVENSTSCRPRTDGFAGASPVGATIKIEISILMRKISHMSARFFTDEEAIKVIQDKDNVTIRMILSKLRGSAYSGSNYILIKQIVKKYNLDTSHWVGSKFCKGKPSSRRLDASSSFERKNVCSHKLKLRLIRDGYKKAECENCELTEWMGQPAPLELHHVDGNHDNNQLNNLRILCPNCHAQTPTNSGKNKILKRNSLTISKS